MEVNKINLFGEVDDILKRVINRAYPVGSLYWTDVPPDNGGDPNELFVGVWKRIEGSLVKAANDNDVIDDNIIGDRTVKLSSSNLPKHTHDISGHRHAITGGVSTASGGYGIDSDNTGRYAGLPYGNIARLTGTHSGTGSDGSFYVKDNVRDAVADFTHTHSCSKSVSGVTVTNDTTDGNFQNTEFAILPKSEVQYCWERTE